MKGVYDMSEERANYSGSDGDAVADVGTDADRSPTGGVADVERVYNAPRGGSRADGPMWETIVERALLAARRLTNEVEHLTGDPHDAFDSPEKELDRLSELRGDADAALYDAERAFGLIDPQGDLQKAGFASWPPDGWDIDRARQLLRIWRDRDTLERAMLVCTEWRDELRKRVDDRGVEFAIMAETYAPVCLTTLTQERIRILAEERAHDQNR